MIRRLKVKHTISGTRYNDPPTYCLLNHIFLTFAAVSSKSTHRISSPGAVSSSVLCSKWLDVLICKIQGHCKILQVPVLCAPVVRTQKTLICLLKEDY
jgi:hypothetical protein